MRSKSYLRDPADGKTDRRTRRGEEENETVLNQHPIELINSQVYVNTPCYSNQSATSSVCLGWSELPQASVDTPSVLKHRDLPEQGEE